MCVVLCPITEVEPWVFDRDLTKGMHYTLPSETEVCSICTLDVIPREREREREKRERRGVRMFDRGLAERMHCIQPIESRRVDLVSAMDLAKGLQCIVPRVGMSRAFDRGSDYIYALYYTQS